MYDKYDGKVCYECSVCVLNPLVSVPAYCMQFGKAIEPSFVEIMGCDKFRQRQRKKVEQ